jgi:hypothetical protein
MGSGKADALAGMADEFSALNGAYPAAWRSSRPCASPSWVSPSAMNVRMLAFIHVFSICVVAAILFVSVDEIEPNRRYALALKFLIVFVTAVAVAAGLMP